MHLLNVLTVSGRPEYLPAVAGSLIPAKGLFEIRWHVRFQPLKSRVERLATKSLNDMLETISDGWVYVLDDDNTLPPTFFCKLDAIMRGNPSKEGFIFRQAIKPDVIRDCGPQFMCVGSLDVAQYVLSRELIGYSVFPLCDGQDALFCMNLYKEKPDAFMFCQNTTVNYNSLR